MILVLMNTSRGAGVLNTLIKKLPFELHLPGYSYCGPGTKLKERLVRGDQPKNKLDSYCKEHDIEYSKSSELAKQHQADKVLQERAWKRVTAADSNLGEKGATWIVTTAMKAKRTLGMGYNSSSRMTRKRRRKAKATKGKTRFNLGAVNSIKKRMNEFKGGSIKDSIKGAVKAARSVKNVGGNKKIKLPRVIRVPKLGGILPLISIFASLSAIGDLAEGASGVAKSIISAQ